MNRELDENLNNAYIVKRFLATLRKFPGDRCYQFNIGDFQIRLFTNADYSNPSNKELERVTDYSEVSFELWEETNTDSSTSWASRYQIELSTDSRFADYYKELKYTNNDWMWKQGKLMPLPVVCDLIKFINRINELAAFQ